MDSPTLRTRSDIDQTITRLRKKITPYIYLLPTLALLTLLMLIPMYLVIDYSFMDNVITNKNPIFVGLENYKWILSDAVFHETLGNILYFAAVSVAFHLVIGLVFAVMLNSKYVHTTTRSIFRIIYVLPWVFTSTIIALLWRVILHPSGVVNYMLLNLTAISERIEWFGSTITALHALTFVNIWEGYPFFMVSLLAGLQGVPNELYEASTIDGANGMRQFLHITVPLLKPIIISISLLDFILTMQLFPLVWMTTGGGPIHATEMLSTYTYKLAFSSFQYSRASASAVIIILMSLFVAIFYVRNQKTRD